VTKRTAPFSPDVRERALRVVRDHEGEHGSQWSASQSIAAKIGCSGETLRNGVCQSDRDQGLRPGQTGTAPFLWFLLILILVANSGWHSQAASECSCAKDEFRVRAFGSSANHRSSRTKFIAAAVIR
jgi:transposase